MSGKMQIDQINRAAASPNETSHLSTLHEHIAENMATSQVSIVNTVEGMQMAVEEFSEHIDHCNISFKQCILEKVKALKQTDETILTERVSAPSHIIVTIIITLGAKILFSNPGRRAQGPGRD